MFLYIWYVKSFFFFEILYYKCFDIFLDCFKMNIIILEGVLLLFKWYYMVLYRIDNYVFVCCYVIFLFFVFSCKTFFIFYWWMFMVKLFWVYRVFFFVIWYWRFIFYLFVFFFMNKRMMYFIFLGLVFL